MTKTRDLADLGGGFIQAGSGAVQRTVESRLQDVVSVKDFGAVGDGVTDDTAAIQAAVAAAAGKELIFPSGTYKTDSFTVPSGTTVVGYGATLDFSSFTRGSRIRLTGSIGSAVALTSNATAGSTSVSVASSAGFAAGDLVQISSDALVPAGAYGDSTQKIGELQIVQSVGPTIITFEGILRDTYNTADSAVIAKVSPNKGSTLLGLTILGAGTLGTGVSSTEIGISAIYVQDLTIRDVHIDLCDYQAISVDVAYNVTIENCRIFNEDRQGFDVIQYGIALKNATDRIRVAGNKILGNKHGIVWTENSKPGVSYGSIITNNFISNTWAGAIVTHESTSDFEITSNNLHSVVRGMDIRVQNGSIFNNKIAIKDPTDSTAEGIYLPLTPANLVISGNYITNSRFGIRMYNSGLSSGFVPSNIVIQNNYIKDVNQKGIYLQQTQNGGPFTGFVIKGNTIVSAAGDFVNLDGEFEDAVISDNLFDDPANTSTGYGVRLQGTTRSIVTGNHSTNITLTRLENDTQSVPEACSYAQVLRNTYTGSGGPTSASGASNTNSIGNIRADAELSYVIAAGVITLSIGQSFVRVDTEGSAATDDLDTINGGNLGDLVAFYSLSDSRDVTFKDGTGNLQLAGDFTLSDTDDVILLIRTGSVWQEVSRSNNT